MFKILLIRPGVTEYDQQERIQGTLDIPLCEDGRRQVEAMVEELRSQPIQAIYTSPSQSAQQTADALGDALNLKVKSLDTLQNLDHGLWQGMLVKDVKTKQPKVYRQWQEHPESVCPPGGEMLGEAVTRVQAAIGRLTRKHSSGAIGLIAPEPLASLVCRYLKHGELGNLWKVGAGGCCSEAIRVEPRALVVAR